MAHKRGMSFALVRFEKRMSQTAEAGLLKAALSESVPFEVAVAKSGGRTVPLPPPPARVSRPNPFL